MVFGYCDGSEVIRLSSKIYIMSDNESIIYEKMSLYTLYAHYD